MGYDPRGVTFYSVSPVALCPVYISPPEQEILDIYIFFNHFFYTFPPLSPFPRLTFFVSPFFSYIVLFHWFHS